MWRSVSSLTGTPSPSFVSSSSSSFDLDYENYSKLDECGSVCVWSGSVCFSVCSNLNLFAEHLVTEMSNVGWPDPNFVARQILASLWIFLVRQSAISLLQQVTSQSSNLLSAPEQSPSLNSSWECIAWVSLAPSWALITPENSLGFVFSSQQSLSFSVVLSPAAESAIVRGFAPLAHSRLAGWSDQRMPS